jgi:hypothetical protein
MMDYRWEKLDNPEANAARAAIIAEGKTGGHWDNTHNHHYVQAEQEQRVVDAREKIEELAAMIKAHKENGEKIVEWLKAQGDIPGVDCWIYSLSEIEDNDIVGEALRWAASTHDC